MHVSNDYLSRTIDSTCAPITTKQPTQIDLGSLTSTISQACIRSATQPPTPEPEPYRIGITEKECQTFVDFVVNYHKDEYCNRLSSDEERQSFTSSSSKEQDDAVFAWLTSPQREQANDKPRLEFRKCSNMPGIYGNLAFSCDSDKERNQLLQELRESGQFDHLHLGPAGRTTVEITAKNVNKSVPIRFLQHDNQLQELLVKIGYQDGKTIQVTSSNTVVISDADGTIWEKPQSGIPQENYHLGNSAAHAAIIEYLLEGGVLVINTGNDPERTLTRFLKGLEGCDEETKKTILSRVLFASAGGGSFAGHIDETLSEFKEYHYFDPTTEPNPDALDFVYLGDDAKIDGNDMPAFKVANGQYICVAPEKDKMDVQRWGLKENTLYGEVESVKRIFTAIMSQAKANLANYPGSPQAPLFRNIGNLINDIKSPTPDITQKV